MKLHPDAARLYVAEAGRLRTPTSCRSFYKVTQLLQSQYPHKDVQQFTANDLTQFCLSRDVAPNTIKNRRAHVRALFEWLTYKQLIPNNVASDLRYTVVAGQHGVRNGNWLTEPQVAELLRAVPDGQVGDRDRVLLLCGVLTGLRCHELAGLRWEAFNSTFTELTLIGKGQKLETIGVPRQLGDALTAWRSRNVMGLPAVLPSFRQVYNLIMNRREQICDWDRPLGVSGIGFVVRAAGLRIGVERLAPHDLRRTFAGLLEEKGVPVTDIQRAMRHANVGITSGYLEKNPRRTVAVTAGFRLEL
jgi:integrase